MIHARKICLSLLILLGCPNLAPATTLYKWVDDDGAVHYTARPPSGRPVQTLQAPAYRGTQQQSPKDPPPLRRKHASRDHENAEAAPNEALEHPTSTAQAELKQHNCKIAQRNLDVLASAMRVQVTDSDGNPYFLDDEARAQRLAQTEKNIKKYCY